MSRRGHRSHNERRPPPSPGKTDGATIGATPATVAEKERRSLRLSATGLASADVADIMGAAPDDALSLARFCHHETQTLEA